MSAKISVSMASMQSGESPQEQMEVEGLECYRSIHAYTASDPIFLSFSKGAILYVYSKDAGGWWDATDRVHRGWVPSNYLEPYHPNLVLPSLKAAAGISRSGSHAIESLDRLLTSLHSLNASTEMTSLKALATGEAEMGGGARAGGAEDAARKSSDALTDDMSTLPMHWKRKVGPDGTMYYYNTMTNMTTFHYHEVIASAAVNRRLSEMSIKNMTTFGQPGGAGATAAGGDGRRKSSLLLPPPAIDAGGRRRSVLAAPPSRLQTVTAGEEAESGGGSRRRSALLDSPLPSPLSDEGDPTLLLPVAKARAPPAPTIPETALEFRTDMANLDANANPYQGPTTFLVPGAPVTNDMLVTNLLQHIGELEEYGKMEESERFVDAAFRVATCARDIIVTTGGVAENGEPANAELATCQQNMIAAIAKLVLYAKAASGLWPPPDAIPKMLSHAAQVLLSTKAFMELCEQHVQLVPYVENVPVRELDRIFSVGQEASQSEFLVSILTIAEQAIAAVRSISIDTQDLDEILLTAKDIISRVGELTALTEEIEVFVGEDKDTKEMSGFHELVEELLNAATELLQVCQSVSGFLPPPDAPELIRAAATNVVILIPGLTVQAKVILDAKNAKSQAKLHTLSTKSSKKSKRVTMIAELRSRTRGMSVSESSDKRASVLSFSSNSSLSPGKLGTLGGGSRAAARLTTGGSEAEMSPGPVSASSTSSQHHRISMLRDSSTGRDLADSQAEVDSRRSTMSSKPEEYATLIQPTKEKIIPYLLDVATPAELTLNMEGTVNGGTVEALVERLTSSAFPRDPNFINSFLLTFRTFSNPEELFTLLTRRYHLSPPPMVFTDDDLLRWNNQKAIPIRKNVCQVLTTWTEDFWQDPDDRAVLGDIVLFADGPLIQDKQQVMALRILQAADDIAAGKLAHRRKEAARQAWAKTAGAAPAPIVPKRCSLMDIDPLELARQITLIESALFTAIEPQELLKQEWVKKQGSRAVHVRAMTRLSTKMTGWIAENILAEADVKQRCLVLKRFIKLGVKLHDLNNFNALMAVYSALSSSTLSRLKKTWALLPSKNKNEFEELKRSVDGSRNYSAYRAKLRNMDMSRTSCLPFLGLYLTDLTFTEEGNPDLRPKSNLINFDKRMKVARSIFEVQKFQQPFALKPLPSVQEWVSKVIEESGMDDQAMYNRSLQLEPREG